MPHDQELLPSERSTAFTHDGEESNPIHCEVKPSMPTVRGTSLGIPLLQTKGDRLFYDCTSETEDSTARETDSDAASHQSYDISLDPVFLQCLRLLESHSYEENCVGLHQLVRIANSDLVNSNFSKDSIWYSLLFATIDENNGFSERLRDVFMDFLTIGRSIHASIDDDNDSDDNSSMSSLSRSEDSEGGSSGATYRRSSRNRKLHLPALRALSSSLQVAVKGVDRKLSLEGTFWSTILQCICNRVENASQSPMEAALGLQCIRFLHVFDTSSIESLIGYSLMPHLMHAVGMTKPQGAAMLRREAKKVLSLVRPQQPK